MILKDNVLTIQPGWDISKGQENITKESYTALSGPIVSNDLDDVNWKHTHTNIYKANNWMYQESLRIRFLGWDKRYKYKIRV